MASVFTWEATLGVVISGLPLWTVNCPQLGAVEAVVLWDGERP
jgi:hypothetical protein